MLRDGQSNAEAPGASGGCGVGLAETIEYEWQEIRGNALPGILNHDPHMRIVTTDAYIDTSTPRSELDRIVEKIPENLLDAPAVRRNRRHQGIDS